ncbi:MAG: hypothetical protein AAF742_08345 [Pseudomonadota bacterium]
MPHAHLRIITNDNETPTNESPPEATSSAALPVSAISVASIAMLASLEIHQWTARKHDKAVSDAIAKEKASSERAGRYNKSLIDPGSLAEIQKVANAARAAHYTNTLPWSDTGWRILPTANYVDYSTQMTGFKEAFAEKVRAFLQRYPDDIKRAKEFLGELYNPDDYPVASVLNKKFSFDINFGPVPKGEDFRVTLSEGAVKLIRADIEARLESASADAMKDLWNRVHLVLTNMRDKLRAYQPGSEGMRTQGVFRDTLIGNMEQLIELLPKLNLLNDPQLEAIRVRMAEELSGLEANTLREDHVLRREASDTADSILKTMADYLGERS